MSSMSSYSTVTALLACHICMTLHLMCQVQQWLHQMLSLQESRLSQEVENLIIQNRKVKGQTQSDRMCWLHFLFADSKSFSVCLLSLIHNPFLVIASSNLNQRMVVVLIIFKQRLCSLLVTHWGSRTLPIKTKVNKWDLMKWQLTPVLLPGKSQGHRSLVGYSPCSRKELDMTEQPH